MYHRFPRESLIGVLLAVFCVHCGDVECPQGYQKRGDFCRPVDAGTNQDSGGTLSARLDGGGNRGFDAHHPDACVPSEALDQSLAPCTSPPITQCTTSFILQNGQSAAQGFRPAVSGKLTRLRLRMSNAAAATNDLQVSLVDMVHDASALTSVAFDLDVQTLATARLRMDTITKWQSVIFEEAPEVIADRHYTIVVRLIGAPTEAVAHWDLYNDWQGDKVDSYPRGLSFSCGNGCPQWTAEADFRDHAFEAHVTPNVCD